LQDKGKLGKQNQETNQRMPDAQNDPHPTLARQIGLFEATMIVMGGIVGAGIFINPYVVAQRRSFMPNSAIACRR
jgi:amino acid transporter